MHPEQERTRVLLIGSDGRGAKANVTALIPDPAPVDICVPSRDDYGTAVISVPSRAQSRPTSGSKSISTPGSSSRWLPHGPRLGKPSPTRPRQILRELIR